MTTSHIQTTLTGTTDPHPLRALLVGASTPFVDDVLAGLRGESR